MNKERLEEIKEKYSIENIKEQREYYKAKSVYASDLIWLISSVEEQAEKITEYEMKYENTGAIFNRQTMRAKIEEQQKEIKVLEDVEYALSETLRQEQGHSGRLKEENARLREVISKAAHHLSEYNTDDNYVLGTITDKLLEGKP